MTRSGPLAFYRGVDDRPEGPEYELAQRFADELGVKLRMTPVRSYAEIYAALNSGQAHLAAAGLKVPVQSIAGIEFGPAYQRVREHLIYRRGATRPASLAEIGNGDLEIAAGSSHAKALYAARDTVPAAGVGGKCQHRFAGASGRRGGWHHRLHDCGFHGVRARSRRASGPAHCLRFSGQSQSVAWAASTRYPEFLRDMSAYFAGLNRNGELASIVNRYYGRSEDAGVRGERRIHAAFAEPLAALQEMVRRSG